MKDNQHLTKTLLAQGVEIEKINHWKKAADEKNLRFMQYIISNDFLKENELALMIAQHYQLTITDLKKIESIGINEKLLKKLLNRSIEILPLNDPTIYLISNPDFLIFESLLQLQTEKAIQFELITPSKMQRLLEKITQARKYTLLTQSKNDTAAIDFIDNILSEAIEKNASDIHFEPTATNFQIRFRLDGHLEMITNTSRALMPALISRLKILAQCELAETRKPQDGQFTYKEFSGANRDCRLSTLPTHYGEKIVIRLLNPTQESMPLSELGFTSAQELLFIQKLKKPQGLILVTGPTGSGKSNTLYTALQYLNTDDKNISTIEDPIEIKLAGLNQVNINPHVDLSFSTALRAFLRQDPDIIMVGEIRDDETAQMTIKAAQTGHLVLATLHTNGAPEAINRLINMGITQYNLLESLTLIIAQRLIRKLCPDCKTKKFIQGVWVYEENPQGCNTCHQGYQGRIGIFEILDPTTLATNQLLAANNHKELRAYCEKNGMFNLKKAALGQWLSGITSLNEIKTYIDLDAWIPLSSSGMTRIKLLERGK